MREMSGMETWPKFDTRLSQICWTRIFPDVVQERKARMHPNASECIRMHPRTFDSTLHLGHVRLCPDCFDLKPRTVFSL